MKRKLFAVLTATALTLGLTACNNGDEALDRVDDNRDTRPLNVRNDQVNDRDNDKRGFGGIDMDADRNSNGDRKKDEDKDMVDISATNTDTPSKRYPETRAILIQDAKYDFVQIDPSQAKEWQSRIEQELQRFGRQYAQGPATQPGTTQQQQGQPRNARPQQQAPDIPQQPTQQQGTGQQQSRPQQEQGTAQQQQGQANQGISKYAQQVIDLTNKERQRAGLPALKADTKLSGVAQKKSQDMQNNNYFSHTSPTYGSPFDMMRDFGVTYRTAGENIAQGQRSPQEVVNAWMNSSGHRKNIMNRDFTHIGVGLEQNGKHWTQMFIGK